MKITDFQAIDSTGLQIAADAHGNNAAFCCSKCGHPVLAIALDNQRGSDESHPAICKSCGTGYFLELKADLGVFCIRRIAV